MKLYRCERDFESKMRPYFIGDVLEESEFSTLNKDERLNFVYIDPILDDFPILFYNENDC